MIVQANGIELKVLVEGQGPAVLLLHGFPDSSALWSKQTPALVEAGFRVITPDLRGFGASSKPPEKEQYALKVIVSDMVSLLDTLQVQQVSIIGHDWGAALAWMLATHLGERVQHLVCISVGHPGGIWPAGGMRQRQLAWYQLFFCMEGVEDVLRANDWQFLKTWLGGAMPADVMEACVADLARPGALTAALNWYRANTKAHNFAMVEPAPFPLLECPVMGIWSDGDRALTEEQMTASQRYVRGPWRYERITRVGHWVPRDAPERLNALLLDFLGNPSKL